MFCYVDKLSRLENKLQVALVYPSDISFAFQGFGGNFILNQSKEEMFAEEKWEELVRDLEHWFSIIFLQGR